MKRNVELVSHVRQDWYNASATKSTLTIPVEPAKQREGRNILFKYAN